MNKTTQLRPNEHRREMIQSSVESNEMNSYLGLGKTLSHSAHQFWHILTATEVAHPLPHVFDGHRCVTSASIQGGCIHVAAVITHLRRESISGNSSVSRILVVRKAG